MGTTNKVDLTRHYKVTFLNGDPLAVVAAFKADKNVESAEPIGIHTLYLSPNDTYYDNPPASFLHDQWHYWDNGSIDADLAWDSQTGSPTVIVGILDSGTRYFHTDLGGNSAVWGPDSPFAGGNIFINSAETPNDGIDNDGNGFVDDVIGWDFVSSAGGFGVTCIDQDCGGVDNDPDDGDGHGTHVSGTVAAITNNGRAVAGVAGGFSNGTTSGVGNGVKILPCRIGYRAKYRGFITGIVRMDWAAEAMNYVASLVDAGNNVAAVNCSWGSSNSGGLDAAVDNLLAHDVMIVHAAGNSNADSPGFLGDKAGVMNVAATGRNGVGASFSNFGSWVDVAAPGVDIMSTYANPDDPDLTHNYVALFAGTSMSAPHICGIAALLESCDPTLTGPQKFALIVNNTTAYNDSRDLGSGIANAKLALNAAGCGSCADVTPVAAFSGSPTSGVVPLTVNFTDATTNNPDTWLWDFGDGNNSSLQNPSHEYTATGTYSVTLTSSNCSGSDVSTQVNYITVTEPPCPETTPVAAFSGSPTSGVVPLTVNFADATTNNPDTWLWDFGDGNNSSLQNPSNEYTATGTYSVTLTASNCSGSDVSTQVDYITVTEPPCPETTPVAAFSGSPTSGDVPLTVNFTDATTNNPDTWLWSFGDGNNSSVQNPSHEYASVGTYTVSLTASNCAGSDISTQVDYITVTEPACTDVTPVAAFSGTPTSGDAPLTVNFTDASTNTPDTWLWSFGDGNNSSVQNPSHEYASAGTYTVSLTASNCGGSDVATQVDYITVTQPPQNMMHVHDIVVTVKQSGRNSSGIGVITIYDQNEQPVANANVTVVATGPTGGTGTAATNENGVVAFETKKTKNHTSEWCFEVTDVTHTTNTYDQASNHVTKACESGDVFGNGSGLSINHLSGAGVGEIHVALPDGFSVSNYPNPFNPSTKIGMNLPVASSWNISIFNIQGRLVEEFNGSSPAGPVVVEWNATSVASGIYFYKITAGEYSVTKKMMFLK